MQEGQARRHTGHAIRPPAWTGKRVNGTLAEENGE